MKSDGVETRKRFKKELDVLASSGYDMKNLTLTVS